MARGPVETRGRVPVRERLVGATRTHAAFSGRGTGTASLLVGDGDPMSARRELLAEVGASPDQAVFMEQVHGAGVAVVGRADRGRGQHEHADAIPGVDALVTTDVGVALVVMVADCVPVLLAVPDRGVAAVHAGRRGVESGVVGAAVATLALETAASPAEIIALVGPAIGGCCYEVPAELARDVSAVVPGASTRTRWGTPALDLPLAVATQLSAAGVMEVSASPTCTRCDAQHWFSHRATTNDSAPAGRQAGAICIAARGRADSGPSLDS
jgi:YfiH family protein